MDKLIQRLPLLIAVVATLHLLAGFMGEMAYVGIVTDGLWNTIVIGENPQRHADFFFLAMTPAWYALAGLVRWSLRETGRIPASAGWWIFGQGLVCAIIMPVSGFWLVALLGLLCLAASRRGESAPAAPGIQAAPAGRD